ncbi:geranylgeranyl reductase family protein [Coleofasciculus chthonoplastes]|uniref:geranylgeranyl reductase family protein n=1 Tax=Coleofasciculus chthonoplastes TaxID=64178 RepID=UPI0032F45301
MFDCIIVGAGPAGATTAYHLAKRGRSVLILEKDSLPRYKPCSGGVSPSVQQWFDFDLTPAIALNVSRVRYTWQMDDPVEINLKKQKPVWMVKRDVFDQFLIEQAKEQGAQLQDQTTVTGIEFKGDRWQVNTTNEPMAARYLIAADGANGSMAKWLGFKDRPQRMAVTLEAPNPAPTSSDPTIHFDFGQVKNGYIWNFPKAEGYSVSVGTFKGNDKQDLQKIGTKYIQQLGIDPKLCQVHSHPMCLWDGNQKLHGQNALLVGDTACLADPFTAEGIRPSIFSGVKAAEAIDAALGGKTNALTQYTQVIQDEWGNEMVWAKRLAGAFYGFPKIGYKVGVKRPSATLIMLQILCGELKYSEVASLAIKRLSGGFFSR